MITIHQRIVALLFTFYVFHENMISGKDDTCNTSKSNKAQFDKVHQLFINRWKEHDSSLKVSSEDVDKFYKEVYEHIHNDGQSVEKVILFIFQNLKNEFDVASCIFKGVAMAGGIEKAVIYVHTTKYVFTSLRYSLDLFSTTGQVGKMEKELAPFALVLNAVLLNWKKGTDERTYSGDDFMCDALVKLPFGDIVAFHTFMPSSTNLLVAKEYAKKKGQTSCIYIFENQFESKYRPREISDFSYEPNDNEAVYPIGAVFEKIKCAHTFLHDQSLYYWHKVCLQLLSDE